MTAPAKMFPITLYENYHDQKRGGTIKQVREAGFPFVIVCIPWAMLAPYEAQAQCNHGQSLSRLAERGGLTADEALAVLESRRWQAMAVGEANKRLHQMIEKWNALQEVDA